MPTAAVAPATRRVAGASGSPAEFRRGEVNQVHSHHYSRRGPIQLGRARDPRIGGDRQVPGALDEVPEPMVIALRAARGRHPDDDRPILRPLNSSETTAAVAQRDENWRTRIRNVDGDSSAAMLELLRSSLCSAKIRIGAGPPIPATASTQGRATRYHRQPCSGRRAPSLLISRVSWRWCSGPVRHPAAENLFLRKQLACYLERQVRPHRTDNASRIALVALSRLVEWRDLLTIVRPETFVRWHRNLSRLFWRVKSRRLTTSSKP